MIYNKFLAIWLSKTHQVWQRLAAMVTLTSLLFLLACGGTYDEGISNGTTDTGAAIDVRLTDSAIEMPKSASVGMTSFKITNIGMDERAVKIEGPAVDKKFDLKSGETKTVRLELEPGTYNVSTDHSAHGSGFNFTVAQLGMSTDLSPRNGTSGHKTAAEPDSLSVDHKDKAPEPSRNGVGKPSLAPMAVEIKLTGSEIMMPGSITTAQKTLTVINNGSEIQTFKIEGTGLDQKLEASLKPGETKTLQVRLKPGTYKVTFGITRDLVVTP